MKKFLIFIFTIFGLFAGMLALIVIDYQINYNKWINSRSGSQVTNPVQKYSTSSDGNKDDFESSKQEYASSSSSTQNYDYKKYASSSDGNKDDLELLFRELYTSLHQPQYVVFTRISKRRLPSGNRLFHAYFKNSYSNRNGTISEL